MQPHALTGLPLQIGGALAFSTLYAFGVAIVGAIAAAVWRSQPMLRVRGRGHAIRHRVFGASKPEFVKQGPDGRWRKTLSPAQQRSERWAGIALCILAGSFAAFVLYLRITLG